MSHSEPIMIVGKSGSFLERQCSSSEFQELEQFWDEEKLRLSDVDGVGQKPAANSWEERLLNDDVLSEPAPTDRTKEDIVIIKGETAQDIPTSYVASGFEPHELIVIGTYVDKNITPGFRYQVRKNLSDDYLFDGKALPLESVGLGYGKRITFQGDSLNENDNYFWSDSRPQGFGFTLQSLVSQNAFAITDTTGHIGRLVVGNPALSSDSELETVVERSGRVEKRVRVHFSGDVTLSRGNSNVFMDDVELRGVALFVRNGSSAVARVEKIVLEDFVAGACCLWPEE